MSLGNDVGGVPAVMNVTPTGNAGYCNSGGWGGYSSSSVCSAGAA